MGRSDSATHERGLEKYLRDIVIHFHGFEPEEVRNKMHARVDIVDYVGFEEVDAASVKELLRSKMEELRNEHILGLENELSLKMMNALMWRLSNTLHESSW
jgi:hypothetical protein